MSRGELSLARAGQLLEHSDQARNSIKFKDFEW